MGQEHPSLQDNPGRKALRMEENQPAERPVGVNRRSFIAAGLKAGVAVAGIGLGLSTAQRPAGASDTFVVGLPPALRGAVVTEPPAPADHTNYVTRPDLTPPAVTVSSGAAFADSGLESAYIFCAPKSPTAANPRPLSSPGHAFPAGATPGLMILDTTGELVWFKPLPGKDTIPFNFRVQTYNGKPTLTWFEGTVSDGHAVKGHYVLADHTYGEIAVVTATDFRATFTSSSSPGKGPRSTPPTSRAS